MDARRGQVYTGIYQFEGTEMQTIKEQCIMMLEDLIEELDKTGKAVIFLGDGVEKGKEIIDAQMKSGALLCTCIYEWTESFKCGSPW